MVALLLAAAFSAAGDSVARIELHPLSSTTLTDEQFLTGIREGKPAQLSLELRLPPGTAKVPAVVLVHGSGGVGANVHLWAQELNAMGIAAAILDSFTGRGISNTLADQSQLGRVSMIADEYRALALVMKHPRIDAARVALMGFSRGGMAALYASLKRFQRLQAMPEPGFAAYVTLYANCGTRFLEDGDVADRPIRMFHGTADNYASIEPCRAYAARLRAAGKDVQLTEIAGAHHAYDVPLYKKPIVLAQAQTWNRCALVEEAPGRIVSTASNKPFTWSDPCVEHGPTIAYDENATARTLTEVKAFLSGTFKLQDTPRN